MSNISCGAQLVRSPSRLASCFKVGAVLGVAINPSDFPSLAYFVSADLYVQLQIPPQPACSKSASYTLKGSGLRVDARPTRCWKLKALQPELYKQATSRFFPKAPAEIHVYGKLRADSWAGDRIRLSLILRVSFESGLCWVPTGSVMLTM